MLVTEVCSVDGKVHGGKYEVLPTHVCSAKARRVLANQPTAESCSVSGVLLCKYLVHCELPIENVLIIELPTLCTIWVFLLSVYRWALPRVGYLHIQTYLHVLHSTVLLTGLSNTPINVVMLARSSIGIVQTCETG